MGEIKEMSESLDHATIQNPSESVVPAHRKDIPLATEGMGKYLPLLEMLERNKDKLVNLLVSG